MGIHTHLVRKMIGNPVNYRGHNMTWNRNRLMTANYSGNTVGFTYDANGLRSTKSVSGGLSYSYYYSGDKLIRLKASSTCADIYYGADGMPYAIDFNGATYYYILNLQGDILGITDANGNIVVTYTYDAWGAVSVSSASGYSALASFNPLRYRGYVYDEETGLYLSPKPLL